MTLRLARALVALYPRQWQHRYAEEFVGFLQGYPATPRTLLNVMAGAICQRFREWRGKRLGDARSSITFMIYALLLAFAAATNLYWTADDSPFIALMRGNTPLAFCWSLIAGGGLVAFLATIICGIRLLVGGALSVQPGVRKKAAAELLMIDSPYIVTFCWFCGVLLWTGGHWAPLPWAIHGRGDDWPPEQARRICACISLVLLIVSLAVTGVRARRILGLADFTRKPAALWTKALAVTIALSVALMAGGCLGWGILLKGLESFHLQPGILDISAFGSWLISCGLFAGSAVAAGLGAK